jgi:hypothetical protein
LYAAGETRDRANSLLFGSHNFRSRSRARKVLGRPECPG